MAQARLSVRKIRDVLRLKNEARLSDRQIAAVLGSARSTKDRLFDLGFFVGDALARHGLYIAATRLKEPGRLGRYTACSAA